MIRRLNKALPALLAGIVLYGIIVQLAGVWFVKQKLLYSTGLWIGIVLAMGMAVHMAVVIEDAVSIGEGGAKSKAVVQSVLRYLVVVLVFFITAKFRLGNILMVFVGVMGLKAAAYMQPFIHRVLYRGENEGDTR